MEKLRRFIGDITANTADLIPRRKLAETEVAKLRAKKALMLEKAFMLGVDALRIDALALHTAAWQKLGKKDAQPTIHGIREFLYAEYGAVIKEDIICRLTGEIDPALQEEKIYLETAQDLNTSGGQRAGISYFGLITDFMKAALENPHYASMTNLLNSRIQICNTSIEVIKAAGSVERPAKEALPRS